MDKTIAKITSKPAIARQSTNGRDWDIKRTIKLYYAFDPQGREVAFDISEDALRTKLTRLGYRITC